LSVGFSRSVPGRLMRVDEWLGEFSVKQKGHGLMATWREVIARDRINDHTDADNAVEVVNLEYLQNKPQAGSIKQHENGTYTVLNEDDGQGYENVPEGRVELVLEKLDIANSEWA
jgi:hypothetical protein